MRLLAAMLALAGVLALGGAPRAELKLEMYGVGDYEIGGDFTLTGAEGEVSLSEFEGKVVLLAFGYTHCPDVCPTTLLDFARIRKRLGPQGERFQGLFVSVDPERDTPAHLDRFVDRFDPALVGLTGGPERIAEVTRRYMAGHRTRNTEGSAAGYLVDHTTSLYLIDRQGKLRYLFPYDTPRETVLRGVRKLMDGRP